MKRFCTRILIVVLALSMLGITGFAAQDAPSAGAAVPADNAAVLRAAASPSFTISATEAYLSNQGGTYAVKFTFANVTTNLSINPYTSGTLCTGKWGAYDHQTKSIVYHITPAAGAVGTQQITFRLETPDRLVRYQSATLTLHYARFADVQPDKWFYDEVNSAVEAGLMNGTSLTIFQPNANTTRAMAVTVLWRIHGAPTTSAAASYRDVASGHFYSDAVNWATQQGIITGFSDGTFRPNDAITRQQLTCMIYRAEKQNFTSTAPLAGFTDANQISSYATMAMAWAISEKLISGYPDQTLRPQNTATRAQFAAIVTRLCAQ